MDWLHPAHWTPYSVARWAFLHREGLFYTYVTAMILCFLIIWGS